MVDLGIFESTKILKWSNALSYNISKAFYDNLKTAQHWKMHDNFEEAYLFEHGLGPSLMNGGKSGT